MSCHDATAAPTRLGRRSPASFSSLIRCPLLSNVFVQIAHLPTNSTELRT